MLMYTSRLREKVRSVVQDEKSPRSKIASDLRGESRSFPLTAGATRVTIFVEQKVILRKPVNEPTYYKNTFATIVRRSD